MKPTPNKTDAPQSPTPQQPAAQQLSTPTTQKTVQSPHQSPKPQKPEIYDKPEITKESEQPNSSKPASTDSGGDDSAKENRETAGLDEQPKVAKKKGRLNLLI